MDKLILLDQNQVAQILGISPSTLEAWRCRGVGPIYRKIGRLCRYLQNDLDAYILGQDRRSTSDQGEADG